MKSSLLRESLLDFEFLRYSSDELLHLTISQRLKVVNNEKQVETELIQDIRQKDSYHRGPRPIPPFRPPLFLLVTTFLKLKQDREIRTIDQ
jgi:hypothetical protein